MKIKFMKPFRFIGNAPDDGSDSEVPVGYIVDLENDESAQWLIDNGFAEKVEQEWPVLGDKYWSVRVDGYTSFHEWGESSFYHDMKSIGNVFKTRESAQRFADYLKAVETVRRDEGFMKQSRKIDYTPCGYTVYRSYDKSIITEASDMAATAGEFYFDTYEHAKASLKAHESEWNTILNYDWSKE